VETVSERRPSGVLVKLAAADTGSALFLFTRIEGSQYMSKIVDLVSLASIVPPLNHEVSGGFNAMVDGKQVRVRAVLERTVVIEHQEGGERSVVRKDNCMVKQSAVVFVPGNPNNGVGPRQWRRLPGKPPATPRVGP
jgi:hypothetical protein